MTLEYTFKCAYNIIMNYISTTDLRNKSPKLRDSLKKGDQTYLVHRSEVIGIISPYNEKKVIATAEKLENISKNLSSNVDYSYKQRKKIYKNHLNKKYGKNIS